MKKRIVMLLLSVCVTSGSVTIPVRAAQDDAVETAQGDVVESTQGDVMETLEEIDVEETDVEKTDVEETETESTDGVLVGEEDPDVLAYTVTSGDYEIIPNGKVCIISKYNGHAKNLEIPGFLNEMKVTMIGANAFKGCTSIESLTIPSNITKIDTDAFMGCTNLKTLKLNEGLKNMMFGCFQGCTSLEKVVVPSTVTDMYGNSGYDGVFENCTSLRYARIEGDQIGFNMFRGCTALKSIDISDKVVKVHGGAFLDCTALHWVNLECPCVIEAHAFENCKDLTELTIKNITGIEADAFRNSGVVTVDLPSSVEFIGSNAFRDCKDLKTLKLREGLKTIEYGAFQDCTSLEEISIPSTVTKFGRDAEVLESYNGVCQGCTGLKKVTIKGSYIIGIKSFEGCNKITEVTIPDTIQGISCKAFYNCSSLKKVTLKNSGYIGSYAFNGCPKLEDLDIKDSSIKFINRLAFKETAIKSFEAPETLYEIGVEAFNGCKNLETAELNYNLHALRNGAFSLCSSLKAISISKYTTALGLSDGTEYGIFEGCTSLEDVKIDTEKVIYRMFKDCTSLKKIELSPELTLIGQSAFEGCTSLQQAVFRGNAPKTFGENAFKNVHPDFIIYYLDRRTGWTDPWNGFKTVKVTKVADVPEIKEVKEDNTEENPNGDNTDVQENGDDQGNQGDPDANENNEDNQNNQESQDTENQDDQKEPEKQDNEKDQGNKDEKAVENVFKDIEEKAWYKDAVQYVYDNGIMSGQAEDAFVPLKSLTRAEFVTVLYNKEGTPEVTFKVEFTDVEEGKWYSKPVAWAAEKGITSGVGEGLFGTETTITREQLATMLYSYAKLKNMDTTVSASAKENFDKFPDSENVSEWAVEAVTWAVDKGVISGKAIDNGTILDPKGEASRAECAQMISNYDNKVKTAE